MQVFADVDDTTHSSGGGLKGASFARRIAGSDPLYYKHEAYPGVAEFYLALSVGPSTDRLKLNPALLSARPEQSFLFGLISLFSEKALARDKDIIEKAQSGNKNGKFYNYQDKTRSAQKWTLNFGGSKGGDIGGVGGDEGQQTVPQISVASGGWQAGQRRPHASQDPA